MAPYLIACWRAVPSTHTHFGWMVIPFFFLLTFFSPAQKKSHLLLGAVEGWRSEYTVKGETNWTHNGCFT